MIINICWLNISIFRIIPVPPHRVIVAIVSLAMLDVVGEGFNKLVASSGDVSGVVTEVRRIATT